MRWGSCAIGKKKLVMEVWRTVEYFDGLEQGYVCLAESGQNPMRKTHPRGRGTSARSPQGEKGREIEGPGTGSENRGSRERTTTATPTRGPPIR